MNTKSVIYHFFAKTKLSALARNLKDPGMAILMFHGLTDQHPSGLENFSNLHVQANLFDDLCAWLKKNSQVLSLKEALALQRAGEPLPRNSVVLTFDDGYASNYHLAYPILRKYNLPATIFAATDFVQNRAWLWPDRLEYAVGHSENLYLKSSLLNQSLSLPLTTNAQRLDCIHRLSTAFKHMPQEMLHAEITRIEAELGTSLNLERQIPAIYEPLTWPQIQEMVASGLITIGAHTHRHLILARCRPETLREELAISNQILADALGSRPSFFAYPNGKAGDFNHATRQALQEAGYEAAVTTETDSIYPNKAFDPLTLGRFGQPESTAHLEVLVSGMMASLTRMARRANSRAAL